MMDDCCDMGNRIDRILDLVDDLRKANTEGDAWGSPSATGQT